MRELEAAVGALTDPVPADFIREFQLSTLHVPVPGDFLTRVIAESRKLPARVWQALLAGMVATGPAAEQQALVDLLGNAERIVYAETGHAPHWEHPERFARDLAEFLRD